MAFGLFMIIGLAVALLAVGVLVYIISIFNGLIRLKNDIKKAFANIDVLLKQRFDELPKLVDTVKGYMKHEKTLLTDITKARSLYSNAATVQDKVKADSMMTSTLKSLFAVAENYPQLKANESFMQLQGRISGIENELADRREFYNDSVNQFNIRIQSIPDIIVARMLSYAAQEMFKAAEEEKKDVKISF